MPYRPLPKHLLRNWYRPKTSKDKLISHSLGAAKAAALPAFHALSRADTDSFSGNRKLGCQKVFNRADEDVITALANRATTEYPDDDTIRYLNILSPEKCGWKKDNEWLPVMMTTPPAPEAIIEMVKCGCVKQRCSTNWCQC